MPTANSRPDAIMRRAARVLLLDGAGRVLLLRGCDPAEPAVRYWFTVGGGLDPGETLAQAAARELYEETGLRVRVDELGEPVWQDVTEFGFDGRWYRQEQDFYVVQVDRWQVSTANFDTYEHATVDEHRWWSPDELEVTAETYYPAELPTLVRHALGAGPAPTRLVPPAGGED